MKAVTNVEFSLSVLRNPHGHPEERVKLARIWAADYIKLLEKKNLELLNKNAPDDNS